MKLMQKKTKIIILFVFLLFAASMLLLGRVGTAKRMEKIVNVTVLTNDSTPAIPSTITIDGTLKRTYLPSASSFEGTFAVEYIERTCRTGSKALISWSNGQPSFAIMDSGTFSLVPVNSIEIDGKMENIRIVFSDGTVIETE